AQGPGRGPLLQRRRGQGPHRRGLAVHRHRQRAADDARRGRRRAGAAARRPGRGDSEILNRPAASSIYLNSVGTPPIMGLRPAPPFPPESSPLPTPSPPPGGGLPGGGSCPPPPL